MLVSVILRTRRPSSYRRGHALAAAGIGRCRWWIWSGAGSTVRKTAATRFGSAVRADWDERAVSGISGLLGAASGAGYLARARPVGEPIKFVPW